MERDIGILHTQGLRTWGTNKRNWHEVLDYETCEDAKYQKCLSFWKSLGWRLNVFLFFFLQVFQVKWNYYFGFGRKKQWNRRRKSKMTWTSCLSQSLDRKCQQVGYVQRAVNAGTHQVTGWGDLLSQWQYNEQWLKRLISFFCYCFLWDYSVQSLWTSKLMSIKQQGGFTHWVQGML